MVIVGFLSLSWQISPLQPLIIQLLPFLSLDISSFVLNLIREAKRIEKMRRRTDEDKKIIFVISIASFLTGTFFLIYPNYNMLILIFLPCLLVFDLLV
ncbi:MAG: hypothetical protein KatS3mg088_078 [Patescibacteria group bacterium]|nr:MAG: hypothetical protein KatS3mg088_078 [Patescibacteria group bacterium]